MKKFTFILLVLSLSTAYAGSQAGKIKFIKIRDDGVVKVGLDTSWTNYAKCRNKFWWVIKDENSVAGKAQLSLLLTAHASGRTVNIGGFPNENNGTCDRMSFTDLKGEDIRNVNITDY